MEAPAEIAAPVQAAVPEAAASGPAVAILEQVKALEPAGQRAFAKLFEEWLAGELKPAAAAPTQWLDFAERIKKIFGGRVLPGDPQEFWDEERGRT